MTSPLVTINGTAVSQSITLAAGAAVTASLTNPAGVGSWTFTCVGTDELHSKTSINSSMATPSTFSRAFTVPSTENGGSYLFESKVNGGRNANNRTDPSLTTRCIIHVLTSGSHKLMAFGERSENDGNFGWVEKVNKLARGLTTGTNVQGSTISIGTEPSNSTINVGNSADILNVDVGTLRVTAVDNPVTATLGEGTDANPKFVTVYAGETGVAKEVKFFGSTTTTGATPTSILFESLPMNTMAVMRCDVLVTSASHSASYAFCDMTAGFRNTMGTVTMMAGGVRSDVTPGDSALNVIEANAVSTGTAMGVAITGSAGLSLRWNIYATFRHCSWS